MPRPSVRVLLAVLLLLCGAGAARPESVEKLKNALRSDDPEARLKAVKSLEGLEADEARKAEVELVGVLDDPFEETGRVAAKILGKLNGVADLVAKLEDEDWFVRARAARDLMALGPKATVAAIPLGFALNDEKTLVRIRAAGALGRLGDRAVVCLPELTGALADPSGVVRRRALETLGHLGAAAEPAVPVMAGLLGERDSETRANVARILGGLGGSARTAVPALRASLRDRDHEVRATVAEALGKIGPAASPAVPDLMKRLEDPVDRVQAAALTALGEIGPAAVMAIPAAAEMAGSDDWSVREAAVATLGRLGRHSPAAAPALAGLLLGEAQGPVGRPWVGGWWTTRREALDALVEVRPVTRVALDALVRVALEPRRAALRDEAFEALRDLGADARPVAPVIASALADGTCDPDQAAWTLREIGIDAAIEELTAALASETDAVKAMAARLLGEAGPAARSAEAALKKLVEEDDSLKVRGQAAKALVRIRGE